MINKQKLFTKIDIQKSVEFWRLSIERRAGPGCSGCCGGLF